MWREFARVEEKDMRVNAMRWIAVVLLLARVSAAWAESASKPCSPRLIQYGSVELTIAGEILVPVNIDGHQGFMVANVGNGQSYLWNSFVDSAHLRTTSDDDLAMYKRERNVGMIKELKIGSMSFGKGSMRVVPPMWAARSDSAIPVIGAIGMDLFEKVDFELDVAHRKLNVFLHDHCPGKVVYWTKDYASIPLHRDSIGNVSIPMELDEKPIEAMIMTGKEITTLDTHVANRLYGFKTAPDGSKTYVAMKMTAPGLTATNVGINLEQMAQLSDKCTLLVGKLTRYSDNCPGIFPMEIGLNVLRLLRLYFATKEQVLYFSTADATM